jgi:hypothetical protein
MTFNHLSKTELFIFLLVGLFSLIIHYYFGSLDFLINITDSKTYIDSVRMLLHHVDVHPTRPIGYAILLIIPYLFYSLFESSLVFIFLVFTLNILLL